MRVLVAILGVTIAACGGAPVALARYPSATHAPSGSTASPSPSAGAVASAGAVPDAGVLYVSAADDRIYRYDGATGSLTPVWRASAFGPTDMQGVYVFGREGGAALLGWSGTTTDVSCGDRFVMTVVPGVGCTGVGTDGVYVELRGDRTPRVLVPSDWAGGSPALSPDGRSVALVRLIARRPPGPGLDPGLTALYVIGPDGTPRELYRPPARGILTSPRWSPDGTRLVVRQTETTSASMAADLVGISTIVVDVASGMSRSLGPTRWETWSPDGRLAYVTGGDRMTWMNKELWVLERDGTEQRIAGDARTVALAPAWGAHGELGWVSGPSSDRGDGGPYIDGVGGGMRSAVARVDGSDRAIRCGTERVVEGLTWSADGSKLLLLCRKVGRDPLPLELWLYRLGDGSAVALVTGLPSDPLAHGFGFYGLQPTMARVAAWSLATR